MFPMQKRIGEYLLEKGLIKQAQIEEILNYSKMTGLRFGDAGLALKLYTREQLIKVFGNNLESDFFYLDPAYFPVVTKDLLSVEQILKFGALPLGFKKEKKLFQTEQVLNLGMLDPSRREVLGEVEAAARAKLGEKTVAGIKVFLILADQYLDVVRDVYGVGDSRLKETDPKMLDSVLAMYLEPAN